MKKLILAGVVGFLSLHTYADQPLVIQSGQPTPIHQTEHSTNFAHVSQNPQAPVSTASLSLGYSSHKGEFAENIDADLDGFAISISTSPQRNGLWANFEFLNNSDFDADYYELSFGGHLNFVSTEHFYLIGSLGAGISLLDAAGFDETVYFTVPVGLEAGVNLSKNISLFGGLGYKWAVDISENGETRCNDGTWSDSTGSGTCSWHGGIDYDYVSNYIGDFDGVTYKAGLRYNF